MSYQVLARKWRPRNFTEMIGQEHVVRALGNALDNDRLHHAYLFTGTRGVGKTTLARILSKSLNCEEGVGSSPCGKCSVCQDIDEGRFVDLLEIDAASKTGVDDTRELLENVPYAPVRGRYKVYLIDEVHMFSNHSFNALLKTLEEPPPHVKFLLATTDPQKVPVTVLSRCLQFNLKRLTIDQILQQFNLITEQEGIQAEASALFHLAVAADGSMRDGLSLLDQAIAFGSGQVSEDDVKSMLGIVATDRIPMILKAVHGGDGAEVMSLVLQVSEQTPDFNSLLRDLLTLLHRVSVIQAVPDMDEPSWGDMSILRELADLMSAEDVQLYYQIALAGQRDLPLAPDPRSGFEMVLLRMLAFRPVTEGDREQAPVRVKKSPATNTARQASSAPVTPTPVAEVSSPASAPAPAPAPAQVQAEPAKPAAKLDLNDWHEALPILGLKGMAMQLASHCRVHKWDGSLLELKVDSECTGLLGSRAEDTLKQALESGLGHTVNLKLSLVEPDEVVPDEETPAQRQARLADERKAAAVEDVKNDPVAREIEQRFDAELVESSVQPLDG